MIDGKSITLYANVKGSTIPIPVEYYDTVQQMTMRGRNRTPVTINGTIYYTEFEVLKSVECVELYIGSSVRVIFSNTGESDAAISASIKISIKGTLSQQITAIDFVSAMIENGFFYIGDLKIPAMFSENMLEKLETLNCSERLKGYKRLREVLESMNVKKDLNLSDCTDEDVDNLNLLMGTIGDHKLTRRNLNSTSQPCKLKISNLTLALVFLEHEKGGYSVHDYFNDHFCVVLKEDDEEKRISQFSSMRVDDFLTLDNLNLDTIVEDYKMIESSAEVFGYGTVTMLEMLKAYDQNGSDELLIAAKRMQEWLTSNSEYVTDEVYLLNKMQIVRRERKLNACEKAELYEFLTSTSDRMFRIGALLLLDEQEEAANLLATLNNEQLEEFKMFPIYNFFKGCEPETTIGS